MLRADVVVGIEEIPVAQDIIGSNLFLTSNPGIESITLNYAIGYGDGNALIKIYDVAGKLVKSYDVSTQARSIHHKVVWPAVDENRTRVPAGIYFVHFKTDDYQRTEKAVLLK